MQAPAADRPDEQVERRPKRRTRPDTPGGVLSDTLNYGILALTGCTAGRRSPAITDRVSRSGSQGTPSALTLWAPDRAASGNASRTQGITAAGTRRFAVVPASREPGASWRHARGRHRCREDTTHRRVDTPKCLLAQVPHRIPRGDTSTPEDLVAQEVSETRDDGLVHQRTLDATSSSRQQFQELLSVHCQSVRAEALQNPVDGSIASQLHALQLTLIAIAQVPITVERQHDAVMHFDRFLPSTTPQ